MADSEVAEVLPFLEDARADVREMAAQGIAGYVSARTLNLLSRRP